MPTLQSNFLLYYLLWVSFPLSLVKACEDESDAKEEKERLSPQEMNMPSEKTDPCSKSLAWLFKTAKLTYPFSLTQFVMQSYLKTTPYSYEEILQALNKNYYVHSPYYIKKTYTLLQCLEQQDALLSPESVVTLTSIYKNLFENSLQTTHNVQKKSFCMFFVGKTVAFLMLPKSGKNFQDNKKYIAMCKEKVGQIFNNPALGFSSLKPHNIKLIRPLATYIVTERAHRKKLLDILLNKMHGLKKEDFPTIVDLYNDVLLFKDCFVKGAQEDFDVQFAKTTIDKIKAGFTTVTEAYNLTGKQSAFYDTLYFNQGFGTLCKALEGNTKEQPALIAKYYNLIRKMDVLSQKKAFDAIFLAYCKDSKANDIDNTKRIIKEVKQLIFFPKLRKKNFYQNKKLSNQSLKRLFCLFWEYLDEEGKKEVLHAKSDRAIEITKQGKFLIKKIEPQHYTVAEVDKCYKKAMATSCYKRQKDILAHKINTKASFEKICKSFENVKKAILQAPLLDKAFFREEIAFTDRDFKLLIHGFNPDQKHLKLTEELVFMIRSYYGMKGLSSIIASRFLDYMMLCKQYYENGDPEIRALAFDHVLAFDIKTFKFYVSDVVITEKIWNTGLQMIYEVGSGKKGEKLQKKSWDAFFNKKNPKIMEKCFMIDLPTRQKFRKKHAPKINEMWWQVFGNNKNAEVKYILIGAEIFGAFSDILKINPIYQEYIMKTLARMLKLPELCSYVFEFGHLIREALALEQKQRMDTMLLAKAKELITDHFIDKDFKKIVLSYLKYHYVEGKKFCKFFFNILAREKEEELFIAYELLGEFFLLEGNKACFLTALEAQSKEIKNIFLNSETLLTNEIESGSNVKVFYDVRAEIHALKT